LPGDIAPAQGAEENLHHGNQHRDRDPAEIDLAETRLNRRKIDSAQGEIEQRQRNQYSG
jgi:hypothetical protein